MVTEQIAELLSAYLDGELSARQRSRVTRLLSESDEARQMLCKLEGDALLLREMPACKLPHDLTSTILGNIAASGVQRPVRQVAMRQQGRAVVFPRWLGYAAAAALVAAVSLGAYLSVGQIGDPGNVVQGDGEGGPDNHPELIGALPRETEADQEFRVPHSSDHKILLGSPSWTATQIHAARPRVPLNDLLEDLKVPEVIQQLQGQVKESASRVDLYCSSTDKAVGRIKTALEGQGINVQIGRAAQDMVTRGQKQTYALYVENVTPAEVAAFLKELGGADKKQAAPLFGMFAVDAGPVLAEDLAKVLGGPSKDFAPALQRPVDQGTAAEIIHSLPGKGKPHRVAVVVPHDPPSAERCSEVKALVDGYREMRAGTVSLLLVLRNDH
jgi:hypothetical protein